MPKFRITHRSIVETVEVIEVPALPRKDGMSDEAKYALSNAEADAAIAASKEPSFSPSSGSITKVEHVGRVNMERDD